MTKTKTKTFHELLAEKTANAKIAKEYAELVGAEYDKAKKLKFLEDQKVTRMNRIAWMAGWLVNPTEWLRKDADPILGNDTAWRYWLTLETSVYRFQIVVRERTDRKRDKFEVAVHGWERELSDRHADIQGGYTYNVRKYGGKPDIFEGVFRSKAEAEAVVEEWKVRIADDFKEHIDWEREMLALAKESGTVFDPHYKASQIATE